jgi:hypothetical protein
MSASPAEIPRTDGAMSPAQLFVINLCASTSPMALAQPSVPALKRFTFFVTRQRDDGRDRFRLHRGYFSSQEEAEQLLAVVRDIYPAAWTGPAPANGAPRRPRATATRAVVSPITVAAGPIAAAPPAAVAAATAAPVEAPAASAPEAAAPAPPGMLDSMSNVREVLAKLEDAPAPRLEIESDVGAPTLAEPEVLRVLEESAKAVAESGRFMVPQAQVRLVTPEDTQTLADMQNDAENSAPQCYAVQLVWSVSPIDVGRLPHLAIFDAYTLYNVEGHRDGRKWYGVRLGFFSDPAAATQVAGYVRSDYRAVAIVPVAARERDGAGGESPKKTKAAGAVREVPRPAPQVAINPDTSAGFQLLEDDRPAPLKRDLDDQSAAKPPANVPVAIPVVGGAAPTAKPVGKVPGKATGKPLGKRVVARKRTPPPPGAPNPLESTLEILGASTLTLDEGREIINDSAVRKPLQRKSGGRFSKLLSRLSGN